MASRSSAGKLPRPDKHDFWEDRDFKGLNTQALRQAIGQGEFSYMENVMPIGYSNLQVVPGPAAATSTVAGKTILVHQAVTIGTTDWDLFFATDGSLTAVNLATGAQTAVAPAATFTAPHSVQWKNERALIIDPNGYSTWDGTIFTAQGSINTTLTVTAGGAYTVQPTVSFSGGNGSGAAAQVLMTGTSAVVSAGGAGYTVGDVLTDVGGAFTGTAAQWKVATLGGGGAVATVTLVGGGIYTTIPAQPTVTSGGTGAGATLTVTYAVSGLTVTASGSGYQSAPTITFSAGAATATASLWPGSNPGTDIETFQGRVWICNGRTITFTAPEGVTNPQNGYNDFNPADAAGSFIVREAWLSHSITTLKASANFLYVWGDSSVSVIGDVKVASSITSFSFTNLSASIGTTFKDAAIPFGNFVLFVNQAGIWAVVGATVKKISDQLDGLFQRFDFALLPSVALVQLYNIQTFVALFRYNDPITGVARSLLVAFVNGKWFPLRQGDGLLSISSYFLNGVPVMFGSSGSDVTKLCFDATVPVAWTFSNRLDPLGSSIFDKKIITFGIEFQASVPFTLNASVDTEAQTQQQTITGSNVVQWTNNSGAVVTWTNNGLATVTWINGGFVKLYRDFDPVGKYLGFTMSATSLKVIVVALLMEYELKEGLTW